MTAAMTIGTMTDMVLVPLPPVSSCAEEAETAVGVVTSICRTTLDVVDETCPSPSLGRSGLVGGGGSSGLSISVPV